MTAAEASKRATTILSASRLAPVRETPALDVSIILSHILGISRSMLFAHPELSLDGREEDLFSAIERRAEGLPVAYITGTKEFWGLDFKVTPAVLIPKPDTEILVERALEIIANMKHARELTAHTAPFEHSVPPTHPATAASTAPLSVLDVCTGSGCIAISLKHSHPDIDVTATDISPAALEVAKANARILLGSGNQSVSSGRIRFVEGDLREGLPPVDMTDEKTLPAGSPHLACHRDAAHEERSYDLVVSNPPYVPSDVTRELLSDGRSEPSLALDGGTDGLDLVRALVDNVDAVLAHGGWLLIETGEYNAREAADYLRLKGFRDVAIRRDLANSDRIVEGRRP